MVSKEAANNSHIIIRGRISYPHRCSFRNNMDIKTFLKKLDFLEANHQNCGQITCVTYLAYNPVFHTEMKHMTINFHFVWELVKVRVLDVRYILTKDLIVDECTKPLPYVVSFSRTQIQTQHCLLNARAFKGECWNVSRTLL